MNFVPSYHRNESNSWNRRGGEDEPKQPNFVPANIRDSRLPGGSFVPDHRDRDRDREREPLPSFTSYGELASNEPTPPTNASTSSTTTQAQPGPENKKIETPVVRAADAAVSVQAKEVVKVEEEPKPPPSPRAPSPPPKGKPTGVMLVLARLIELEASMEYAYTKHMLLEKRRKEVEQQHKLLENLPVGIEAIKEDLEKPRPGGNLYDV